jgi:hypothetical protein
MPCFLFYPILVPTRFFVDILCGYRHPIVGAGCTPVIAHLAPDSPYQFSPSWFSSSLAAVAICCTLFLFMLHFTLDGPLK